MPFRAPTRLFLGPGSFGQLAKVVADLGCRRVLLVTDRSLEATPWPARAVSELRVAAVAVETFADVEANPRTTTAERAAALAKQAGCEAVLGLGGGSVLDCAKAAAMLATNPGGALAYVGRNRFSRAPLPFVAIPTTCGTGSEVTWVSVLTDPATRNKVSLKGDGMFPAVALVDPETLVSLPPAILAATAVDALTHALEATTVTPRNPVSDALAEKAITLLFAYLPRAYRDLRGDAEARAAVARAATLAGLAFGSADVGAVHCLSESLGGRYDVPHGLANAVLLVPTLRAHGAAVEARLAQLDLVLRPSAPGDERARAQRLLADLERLLAEVAIPSFRALEVPEFDYDKIAAMAVSNGSNASNPRSMREADYVAILRAAAALG